MLNMKQRYLVSILSEGERVEKLFLTKLMFLLSKDPFVERSIKFYDFVPYKYGPFSFEIYNDLSRLEKDGLVELDDKFITLLRKPDMKMDHRMKELIQRYNRDYGKLKSKDLIDIVYSKYPEYTIFSEIDKRMDYSRDEIGITNIGYEGKTIDVFLYELVLNKVTMLVDVRHNPFSMKFQFNKKMLQSKLEKMGIEYKHIPELGIPGEFRKDLKTKEDYEKLFVHYRQYLKTKTQVLNELVKLGREDKIALMCFEKDPNYCHRGIISEFIRERGIEVKEI